MKLREREGDVCGIDGDGKTQRGFRGEVVVTILVGSRWLRSSPAKT